MAKYFKNGNVINVAPDNAVNILDELTPDVYTLKLSELTGFYLELIDDFKTPDHIYGDIIPKVNKIIKTYEAKTSNVGVLLSGEKGSGKTMMLRLISNKCKELGIPTIIIPTNFETDFCKFISDINQKCVIVFDEFEKVFKKDEEQSKLLTLFEGVYSSNKLLILTINNIFYMSEFFLNRPGRIHYHIKFDCLEEAFVKEYCEHNLIEKTHTDSIVNLSKLIPNFNFDMLQAIVFECNLHGETPQQAFSMLNIRNVPTDNYNFEILDTNKDRKYTGRHNIIPFSSDRFYFSSYSNEKYTNSSTDDEESDEDDYPFVLLSEENLISVKDGRFEFKDRNFKILLRKEERKTSLTWEF